jgi:uncharacterized protein YecE (DUF72 family)
MPEKSAVTSIHLGTSSFSATGWEGSFPPGLKSSDYLSYYADHFDSVEVDSTFYACPSSKTVSGWFSKTPDNFIFSVKVPQTITHNKVLVDCDAEFDSHSSPIFWHHTTDFTMLYSCETDTCTSLVPSSSGAISTSIIR